MNKKKYILICVVLIQFLNFDALAQWNFHCEQLNSSNNKKLGSTVNSIETIGIADTTVAMVEGNVCGIYEVEGSITIDSSINASVIFFEPKTGGKFLVDCDRNGNFELSLPAGQWEILVGSLVHQSLYLKNVILGTGEIVFLKSTLAQGKGRMVFTFNDEREVTDIVSE